MGDGEQNEQVEHFFSKIRRKFLPIPSDSRIEVKPFLAASREVVDILDLFGIVLKPVKSDINGNITALQDLYDKKPDVYRTFNDMLEEEGETQDGTACNSLLWLKRALDFLCNFISLLVEDFHSKEDSDSLSALAQLAYERSLEPYHNFIVRNFSQIERVKPFSSKVHIQYILLVNTHSVESMLLRLIPSRTSLYKLLIGQPTLSEQHAKDIEEASQLLTANLTVINNLYPVEERSAYNSTADNTSETSRTSNNAVSETSVTANQ